MNYVQKVISTCKDLYYDINGATLTGAIDVVVVEQEDGTYLCSPFHVRFGKMGVLRSREKVIDIYINDKVVDLQMKLGDSGVAFFVEEVEEEVPVELATSPLPGQDAAEMMAKGVRQLKDQLAAADAVVQVVEEPALTDCAMAGEREGQAGQVASNSVLSGGKGRGSLGLRKIHNLDHPFSDGEDNNWLRPDSYSRSMRKASCPLSDTEAEMEQRKEKLLADSQSEETDVMWNWGGLPHESHKKTGVKTRTSSNTLAVPGARSQSIPTAQRKNNKELENPSILSSVMQLVGRGRRSKRFSEDCGDLEEGVYLHQIENSEQAAQYFPSRHVETLATKEEAVQTVSEEREGGTDSGTSSDQERAVSPVMNQSQEPQMRESLQCDMMMSALQSLGDLKLSLCGGLKDPDTVIPEEKFLQREVKFDAFCEKPGLLMDQNLVVKLGGRFYSWQVAAPIILSVVAFGRPLPQKRVHGLVKEHMGKKRRLSSWFMWRRQASEGGNEQSQPETPPTAVQVESNQEDLGKPERIAVFSSDEDIAAGDDDSTSGTPRKDRERQDSSRIEYKKSLRLSSDQIGRLNLRRGANEVVFSVTTKYQGTTKAKSTIYLWHYTDNIVVSDIDGTITKSDLYGQILPFFGHPWAQSGVTELFTSISDNGYQFVYLSSRAIGQARTTRGYLKNLKQGEISLPDGPLLLSPSSLFSAFRQEVILRKPEEFKKAALMDIKSLFPLSVNPFYAGFGNRVNDEWAYREMHVPPSRIFIINPKGEVVHALSWTLQTSYSKLKDEVNCIFPPLSLPQSTVPDEYTDMLYWRDAPTALSDSLPV